MTTKIDNHQDIELNDFFKFEGRINRAKYIDIWGWNFTAQVTFILLFILCKTLGTQSNSDVLIGIGFIALSLFGLVSIVGTLSLILNGIRRAHDCNKSGWFSIIPFYNIYLLLFVRGTDGENKYGNNPLDKNLPKKAIDEIRFNRQQKILRTISFVGIFGGFIALTVIILFTFLK